MRRMFGAGLVILLACFSTVHAQWLNYRTPGIPRTPDGKPQSVGASPANS